MVRSARTGSDTGRGDQGPSSSTAPATPRPRRAAADDARARLAGKLDPPPLAGPPLLVTPDATPKKPAGGGTLASKGRDQGALPRIGGWGLYEPASAAPSRAVRGPSPGCAARLWPAALAPA